MDKNSISARKQRWNDLLSMSPSVNHTYLIYLENDPDIPPRPFPGPHNKAERIEWAWSKYNVMLERMSWLKDDSIPFLDVYSGTEIFAEAFGCKVHRPEENMPFALPMVHNAHEASRLKVPDLYSSPLTLLFEIADELRNRAGSDALLRIPDIQSPMDIAALIWDKNDYYIALLEEPEAVLELACKVKELLTAFLDEWFKRYGKEFIAHYPDYYMSSGITLSEDEVGVVNDEMFLRLFLPELAELSNRYGRMGVHCCANSRHQWENFKKIPNLCLLNLGQPEETLNCAHSFFAHEVAQMHAWCGKGPAWTWIEQLPERAHVVLQPFAKTKEEAKELADKLQEACTK